MRGQKNDRRRFQSTLPARGATTKPRSRHSPTVFQSTLPARGATAARGYLALSELISIHAPREGSDKRRLGADKVNRKFQSTLPARGATYWTSCVTAKLKISIHAPREGSDAGYLFINQNMGDFNPRSPRGERRWTRTHSQTRRRFQSTLPARGATRNGQDLRGVRGCISIHAPREGSDTLFGDAAQTVQEFQSTLPARGATPRKR